MKALGIRFSARYCREEGWVAVVVDVAALDAGWRREHEREFYLGPGRGRKFEHILASLRRTGYRLEMPVVYLCEGDDQSNSRTGGTASPTSATAGCATCPSTCPRDTPPGSAGSTAGGRGAGGGRSHSPVNQNDSPAA